jgi:hypothetical protein
MHDRELCSKKKNEMMTFAGKWVELEIIMLSDISQDAKNKIECFHVYVEFRP